MIKFGRLSLILVLILFVSGCSFLAGKGPDIFDPGEKDYVEDSIEPSDEPSDSIDPAVPIADGFDFPVGGRNGEGWAITGYDFLVWSNASNSWHPGEDWNIPGAGDGDWGEPVYSIGHGVVVFSGWNTAQGNIVTIEHQLANGSKVWSQYAHLDQRYVQVGETVERRQEIGTVGRGPNNRFTAHLHFEIRKTYLASNAWPRTNGQPWNRSQLLQHWLHPSNFINQNRPHQ
ncbi:MAG: M23 family metallopeptidase [Firmicutes bacterium]|nr:M23 family metallopeptidase [Bacillota bacterium]